MHSGKRIAEIAAGLVGLMFAATVTVQSTTLARLTLDQLTASADAVVRVRCVKADAKWVDGEIWTITTFDVTESLKGALATQVNVRLPGGRVGHLTAAVDGTPRFSPGDDTIVFLQRVGTTEFSVAGWVQGTFRIAHDRAGNETVTQDSSSFAVFDTASKTFRTQGIRGMPLDEFRREFALSRSRAEGKIR